VLRVLKSSFDGGQPIILLVAVYRSLPLTFSVDAGGIKLNKMPGNIPYHMQI
jgi:hypothetical protein